MAKRKDSRSATDTSASLRSALATLEVAEISAPVTTENAGSANTEVKPSDQITLSEAPTLVPTAADMIGPHLPMESATVSGAAEVASAPVSEAASAPAAQTNPSATRPSTSRPFLRLAATVALAAALGAVLGAVGVSAVGRLTAAPVVHTVEANPAKTAKLEGDIAALKASLEAATKNTNGQFGKLAERLERTEKAQVEPTAKLAKLSDKITDALERFDQRLAAASAPETTGSVPATRSAAASDEPKLQDKLQAAAPQPVIAGWVLRDISDGRALVESRYGMYEVSPGGNLPGLGRVATIKRQDGRWVVVTPKGVIVSER
ncbi:MAG: hypothetical protein JWN71_3150 [Xanthobacteraceae bacterium]|jgi:hypothetical protein|nr:hypothetical protein [Xanthobacteraceae bacterium]